MRTSTKLAVICSLALIFRLTLNIVFQGINSPPDPDMGPDHIQYDLLAQNLARGKGFSLYGSPTVWRPPGTSFLLVPIYYFFGVNYAIVRILWSLFGALTCLTVYFIGKKVHSENCGLLAAALLAIYPMHAFWSQHLYAEVPWAFFMSLAAWCTLKFEEKGRALYGILAGITLGFCAYLRPVTFFYFPPYVLLVLVRYFMREKQKCLSLIFIPLITMTILIIPWTIRGYAITKRIIPISGHSGETFFGANNEKVLRDPRKVGYWVAVLELPEFQELKKITNTAEYSLKCYEQGFRFIRSHLRDIPFLELMKIYRLITPLYDTPNRLFNLVVGSSWGLLFPFFLIGAARTVKKSNMSPLHAVLLSILLASLIYHGDPRYWASVSPIVMIYVAIALLSVRWRKALSPPSPEN